MQKSPLNAAFAAAGARMGARPEAPALDTVLTFGDVPAEYAAAREGCILLDASDRACVAVEGSEAATFLHRILANDVRGVADGEGNANLLLTAKGKVQASFDLTRSGERFELVAPPGTGASLASAIDMFLFTEDARLEDRTETIAPLELAGPKSIDVVEAAFGAELPEVPHRRVVVADGISAVRRTIAGTTGVRIDAGPERLSATWDRLREAGAVPAGVVVRDIVRCEERAALFGVDVDDGIYPQEARLDDAFSLEKGCYVGQEVVAKIDTYGGLNKLLFALRVEHDDPIPRGARLLETASDEGRDVGVVTSWAYSFVHDTGLVLAYVKRRHHEPGGRFRIVVEGNELGTAELLA